jgi:predicted amidophosphoribosyltransferase
MPYTCLIDYACPVCKKQFQSTHYKPPERCPECRRKHRAKRSLANYHKRFAEGTHHTKDRDTAYDGVQLGAPPSVYASTCVIHLRREVAPCQCCGNVRELINGYCEMCRGNGANEAQCANATRIR